MAIRGEAGIGKSRLVHEFIAKHRSGEGFLVLRGQTLSFAQPPCWAWTTLLRNLMGVQHGSDTDYDQFRPGSKALASMKTSRTRRLSLPHCFP
jgi:predicted ATPase